MNAEDRKVMDAYLGQGIRREGPPSSVPLTSSRWLNSPVMRDVIATWMLRKNGPDFPVEADHTLGLMSAMAQVQPDDEVNALFEEEIRINPAFAAWMSERFVSSYSNEDFNQWAPGTVGGIIGKQIRERGFDINLGAKGFDTSTPLGYWRARAQQSHDFEHIVTGGQFNSLGEIVVIFARATNQSQHLSPKLASAVGAYVMFSGMRMISRSLLHYPETWMTALRCLEQGIQVGRESPPFWFFRWEEVFHMTPSEARAHFGMPEVSDIECFAEAAVFREDPELLALAAE